MPEQLNPANLPVFWQVLLGVITFITGLVTVDKYRVMRAGNREAQAESNASTSQYKALQDAIDQHTKQLSEMRGQMAIMDKTIHGQQIEITQQAVIIQQQVGIIVRMDGLIDQLRALLVALGHPVPSHIQIEIDMLNESEMKRRKEDKDAVTSQS